MPSNLRWLILALIISLGLIFLGAQKRSVGYWVVPDSGILDELSYAWQGLSIRQAGVPIGWSDSGVYHGGDINKRGVVGGLRDFYILLDDKPVNISNISKAKKPFYAVLEFDSQKQTQSKVTIGIRHIDLVAPFFDHPPLGGLIFSLGVTPDTKTFSEVTTFQTRRVSLFLAVFTGILIFILTFLLTKNPFLGVLSVSLYNFVPSYFFASRFALLENILAPFALFHLIIFYLCFQNRKKVIYWILAGLTGGLICLIKESAFGFVIGSLILMKLEKLSIREFKTFLISFLIPIILYVVWAFNLSAQVFMDVLIYNGSRQFWGSLNFLTMLTSLRFRDFPFDGWWIFGFTSFLILSIKKTSLPVRFLIPAAVHLIMMLFLGGQNYPWYYLALIPFLVIATTFILWEMFIYPQWGLLIAFFTLALSSSLYWGRGISQFTPSVIEYRLLLLLTFITGFLANLDTKKFILVWRVLFIILLLLSILLNYKSITNLMANWGADYPSLPPT